MMFPGIDFPISNKTYIKPRPPKPEPVWNGWGWDNGSSDYGYEFRQFLGNTYGFLGEVLSSLDGMQQLIHHYYLQNGSLSAKETAKRIVKFLTPQEQL